MQLEKALKESPINSSYTVQHWSTWRTLKPKKSPQQCREAIVEENTVIPNLNESNVVKAAVKRFVRLCPKISPKDTKAECPSPSPPKAQFVSQDSDEDFGRYSCINPTCIIPQATLSTSKNKSPGSMYNATYRSPISTLDSNPFTFPNDVSTPGGDVVMLPNTPPPQEPPILSSPPKKLPLRKDSFKPPQLEIEDVELGCESDVVEAEEDKGADFLRLSDFISSCKHPLRKSPSLQTFMGSQSEDMGLPLESPKNFIPCEITSPDQHFPIMPSSCPSSVQPPPTPASHQPRYGPQSARAAEEDRGGEKKKRVVRRAISFDSADVSHILCNEYVDIKDYFAFREELGSGTWGTVRRCIDVATGHQLACKTVPKSKLKCELDVRDLKAEVKTLTAMQGHPGIVKLEGVFEDAKHVHLIMEYCDGGELFHRIKELKHFQEAEAAQICATLVSVLEHCHKNNVMHRDLKPENILLTSKNSNTDVRVADFGSATFFNPDKKLKLVVGSPLYMAPCVLDSNYGPEADMWSLGVILYILLCGVPPFWGPTNSDIFQSIHKDELDLSSGQWQFVSCAAKDLVRGLLRKDPKRRMSYREVQYHHWIEHFPSNKKIHHHQPVHLSSHPSDINIVEALTFHGRRHSLSSI